MRCPDCDTVMELISGIMVCPECDMLNKTIEEKPWIQGDKDDSSDKSSTES